MDRDALLDALRAQLVDYLYFGSAPAPIGADEDLFELGLDSLGITRLVAWLRSERGISIPEADLRADHFRSLAALADLALRRR